MTDRRFTDRELETALRDVGAHLAYPPTADLLPAVRARLEPRGGEGFWATLWSPRVALVPALATVALLLVAALAFQPIGATAVEALGLRGLVIFRTAETPPPSSGAVILPDAKRVASLATASREVGFDVVTPGAVGAPPDEIYVREVQGQRQAILVYRAGASDGLIPPSKVTGIGMLIIEARGSLEPQLLGKVVGPGTRTEPVDVNGVRGVWLEGELHQFFFRAPSGEAIIDSVRLAGNVLAFERAGVLIRIEADVTKDVALRFAATTR